MSGIHMPAIYQIESSNNPNAHNKTENAIGLGQIRPVVTLEWNQFHPDTPIKHEQLFDPTINSTVSNWYMNQRIPQMLRRFGLQDTDENRIAAYNAGIGNVVKGRIPSSTKEYIGKYRKLLATPRAKAIVRSK